MRPRRADRRRAHERRGLLATAAGVAGVLLLASLYLMLLGRPPAATDTVGGPFRLAASDGRTVTDRSFPGRYMLIYFGYSHCRDVCPTTLAALAAALDAMGTRADRVQPLFVTVDPQRDSPAALDRYVADFTPRLLGLTGTPAQIRAMEREYRVRSTAHRPAAGDYDIEHSSVLYLMAPDGTFLAPIRADESAAAMASDIERQLS